MTNINKTDAISGNILVVDDVPANLTLLAGMLKEKGHRVRPVPSGKLALKAVETEPPDLILLDITMPEMDGFEVCSRLKQDMRFKEIPIIFISALTETLDKVKAFGSGGVDYITKPFQFEEVHARVETHLNIRALQRRLYDKNENLELLVAERTRDLDIAYKQLQKLDQIKDNFLRMISYEIRTPANGVLGVAELILSLCPDSDDCSLYTDLFEQSSLRLRNLIDDATLICDIENLARKSDEAVKFSKLMESVSASLPDIALSSAQDGSLNSFVIKGNEALMTKAINTMIHLAMSFSRDKKKAHLSWAEDSARIRLRLDLDELSLSAQQVADFFEAESTVRGESTAESLGLAPIVAHKIVTAFGGEMKLVKGEGNAGHLEAMLLKDQTLAGQA